jgi:hypothetical protein
MPRAYCPIDNENELDGSSARAGLATTRHLQSGSSCGEKRVEFKQEFACFQCRIDQIVEMLI